MKITLAFLLFGTCLVLTNAKAIKKPVHETESWTHARMMTIPLNRWREWQECGHRCSAIERSCKLRAITSDCFLILRIMANDLGVGLKKLISVRTDIKITVIVEFVEKNDHESCANYLEKYNLVNKFMEMMCLVMKGSTDEAGLDLGGILVAVLGDSLGSITGLLGGILGTLEGIVGGAVGALGGVANAAGDVVGSLTGALGGLTGGLGGLTGGLTGGGKKGGGGLLG